MSYYSHELMTTRHACLQIGSLIMLQGFFSFAFFCLQFHCVFKDSPELTMQPRLALNSQQFFYLSLPSIGITCARHHHVLRAQILCKTSPNHCGGSELSREMTCLQGFGVLRLVISTIPSLIFFLTLGMLQLSKCQRTRRQQPMAWVFCTHSEWHSEFVVQNCDSEDICEIAHTPEVNILRLFCFYKLPSGNWTFGKKDWRRHLCLAPIGLLEVFSLPRILLKVLKTALAFIFQILSY